MLFKRRCSLKDYVILCLALTIFIMIFEFTGIEQITNRDTEIEKKRSTKSEERQPFVLLDSPEATYKYGEIGNFEPPAEKGRKGPGEHGKGVTKARNEESMRLYGCDMTVSDMISLDRTIRDTRDTECKYWHYPAHLPSASVIIVFYNEGNSTLLRTVHSVMNRSPPSLLVEVVLVDDGSTFEHLKKPLETYIRRFHGKVKLFRNNERLGLIGARMRGAEEATGDVIVVLDSHCECNVNWLPPLLQRIALNRKTLAQPTVDMIMYDTFAVVSLMTTFPRRGVFDWSLLYKEMHLTEEQRKERMKSGLKSEPYSTPTHAGGLFAIDRRYFFEIGGYDPNILIWGGENFQLSFKLWMCGGKIEMVPCSRVGHVYHRSMPFTLSLSHDLKLGISVVKHNYLRVVEGWMDEYKKYYYIREPDLAGYYVNVTDQLALRKRLGCKSFHWYMNNVAKEMLNIFSLPLPNKSWGKIQERYGRRCLHITGNVGKCSSQIFRHNTAGQIATGEQCMVWDRLKKRVQFKNCHSSSQYAWDWNEKTGLIREPNVDLCLEVDPREPDVFMAVCDINNYHQQWDMRNIKSKIQRNPQ